MPELPEVELAARSLRQWLAGRRVTAVTVLDAKLAGPEVGEQWLAALVGQECERIERRAKYLLARFTGGHTLIAHLRMEEVEGRWALPVLSLCPGWRNRFEERLVRKC